MRRSDHARARNSIPVAAELTMDNNYQEALMSAELSRFWSTVNRKFDHERPQLNFCPRTPVGHNTSSHHHQLLNDELQVSNEKQDLEYSRS